MEYLPFILLIGFARNRRYRSFEDNYDYLPNPNSYLRQHPDLYEQERSEWLWREEEIRRRRYEERNNDGSGCLMFLLAFLALVGYCVSGGK